MGVLDLVSASSLHTTTCSNMHCTTTRKTRAMPLLGSTIWYMPVAPFSGQPLQAGWVIRSRTLKGFHFTQTPTQVVQSSLLLLSHFWWSCLQFCSDVVLLGVPR